MKNFTSTLIIVLICVKAFGSGHTVTITSTNASCNGACNGTATANVSGGLGPFVYNWVPNGGTDSSVFNLCAGSYTLTVMDMNDMSIATATVTITQPAAMILTTTTTPSNCSLCDGTASVNVAGASPPFTYYWMGPGVSASMLYLANACAGTYTVTVSSASGCMADALAIVGMSGNISNFYTSTTTSNCNVGTGSINVDSVIGGVSPFTYSIDLGTYSSSPVFTGLMPDSYNVKVKDSTGCVLSKAITVNPINPPIITLDSINDIGCSNLGGIYVSFSGGTPPYTYVWDGIYPVQDYINIDYPGSHSINIIDSMGCSSTQSFSVNNSPTLHGAATTTMGNCSTLPTATATGIGGVPPYSYLWNTSPAQTVQTIDSLSTGNYMCLITDSTGCSKTVNVYVAQNCFNIIKGRVYNDLNANCIQDSGELGMPGRVVNATGNFGYTTTNGNYTIYSANMTNMVTCVNSLYSSVICPVGNIQPANFVTLGDTIYNIDFAVQMITGMNDLQINYWPGVARPGFPQSGYLHYQNVGTTIINGVTINLNHDSILTYNYSNIPSTSYTYPNIGWNIGSLNPGQSGYIYTNFTIPTMTNGGYLGRVLNYNAQINPIIGDTTPINNVTNSSTMIVGSYDPNLKSVSPEGNILATDSVLHYTIQFQNTGTDTAFTIVLKDTLSQHLDPSTVEPGIASHPYIFNIAYSGELTWRFSNILLVDSTTNEQASHGFATFTVKQKSNNPIGSQIENTASIYFDFNTAVVTNTVSNTVVDIATDIISLSTNNVIKIYPNPFSDNTTFVIQSEKVNEKYSFELVDVLGKKVRTMNDISAKQFTISRNGLQNGIYFYKIYSAESIVGVGKLIVE